MVALENLEPRQTEIEEAVATTIRMLAIDAVQQANSGHPGLPLGAADIVATLWTRAMRFSPANPAWADRDRFVLSAGHGSAMLYALLHLLGLLPLEELKKFRQWESLTPGHPEVDREHGIEMSTGPLGQGISSAVGMAIAERWLAARFNRPDYPVVDHYTYVLASDGDLMEGISHEAGSLAGHLGLGKLIVFFDDNGITIDGTTDLSCSDDVLARFGAYGWHTCRVDGHDMAAIDAAIREAQADAERPSLIACRTHIGLGSPRQDTSKVHGEPLGDELLAETKQHYGWPVEPRFHVPAEVAAYFAALKAQGREQEEAWNALFAGYREAFPELAEQWDAMMSGGLPAGWEANLPDFTGSKPMATRAASGKVLDAITPHLPMLLGGSADLSGSNKTAAKGVEAIRKGDFSGQYVEYGIREHAMGAVMNGMALHGGIRPFGGTFLVFSDYMRPSIRLAALMKLPVVYVFSHDSIGLGEDGPTHQPIEHLTALRAIPNLAVIRPADANETAAAWKAALNRSDGPTALILTRQNLPLLTPAESELERGAYILADADSGRPDVVVMATGSEVELAMQVRQELARSGIPARVVSMPCWELFDAQDEAYQQRVLRPDVPLRVAIEAGSTLAWGRYTGPRGYAFGIDRFGESAPYETLYDAFGLTAEQIARRIYSMLG